MNHMTNSGIIPTYDLWRQEFVIHFRDENDIERHRSELLTIRQLPDQHVRSFVSRLNSLYDLAKGKAAQPPKNVDFTPN